jgi:hypothetical protein
LTESRKNNESKSKVAESYSEDTDSENQSKDTISSQPTEIELL